MNNLIIVLKSSFFLVLLLITSNLIIYINAYFSNKKRENLLKLYEKKILEFLFSDNKEVLTDKIDFPLFIEKVIEINSTIIGPLRKNLINLCEQLNISTKLLKKINSPFTNKTQKELVLYQIGELRSIKLFDYFLTADRDYIKKYDLYRGYFFACNNIVNEWIDDLTENQINNYIDFVFLLIEESKLSKTLNTGKLFEILLTDTSNLFKYVITHDGTRRHMIKSLITKDIPLAYKGQVLYIMILNFEYRINNFIKKEFSKYIVKENLSSDELNYLIFLIKSLGEMGLNDGYNSFKKACENNNWTIKAIAAKYLYKYDEEESYEYLRTFLHDSVWWVRNNAALSLDKMGETGISILFDTIESEDKFAKEISSYVLASGTYYSDLREQLINGSSNIKNLNKLIKSPSGLVIIDRIITDKGIDGSKKLEVIMNIDIKSNEAYLLNLVERNSIDFEIRQYIKRLFEIEIGEL